MRHVPAEYDDKAYFQEVLQLEISQTDRSNRQHDDEKLENIGILSSSVLLSSQLPLTSSRESDKSRVSVHVRTVSSTSLSSSSTAISSQLSNEILEEACTVRRKKEVMARMDVLPQSHEKFIGLNSSNLLSTVSCQINPASCTLIHPKSYMRITDRLRTKVFKGRPKSSHKKPVTYCVRCRESFENDQSLHSLPCRHIYCKSCLQTLIMQVFEDEGKMPPRCCNKMIPGSVIAAVLKEDERLKFLRTVLQLRAHLESQILCPNVNCSGLLGECHLSNPLRPLEVVCRKCDLCICSLCKAPSHTPDKECSMEWARATIVQLNNREFQRPESNWKSPVAKLPEQETEICDVRDVKENYDKMCEALCIMEISNSDPTCMSFEVNEKQKVGNTTSITQKIDRDSPKNLSNTEEKEKRDENKAAAKRSAESVELSILRTRQVKERDRFCAFERKMTWCMTTRHSQERVKAREKYEKRMIKMKEHHAKIAAQLEDMQVAAEFEMISKFKRTEQNVRNRLRHMEAYCDALGRDSNDPSLEREVTEKDLRQLGQQYNLRDSMYHVHQSKIKVLRDKQAKQMERLLRQQEQELERFMTKREDLTLAEQRFKEERDGLSKLFATRKLALLKKWALEEQTERERLEKERSVRFAPLTPPIDWPSQDSET